MWSAEDRARRMFLTEPDFDDQKSPFQRDVDRILYSSAFRRLAGVTQIVRSGEEDVFHNRLTHTIKVAQVGRRVCQRLASRHHELAKKVHLNADVVEAACLAHDLGHPPFGHYGEKTLNRLVLGEIPTVERLIENPLETVPADLGGFEGNAQTLRIITKLSALFERDDGERDEGLDLTRAVVAACIKYPWAREPDHPFRSMKWGYYKTEEAYFKWARTGWPSPGKTIDCQIMDVADDITYSVHDLEDFHRCGVIPWRSLFPPGGRVASGSNSPAKRLIDGSLQRWQERAGDEFPADAAAQIRDAHRKICELITPFDAILDAAYDGSRQHRVQTRQLTSTLVGYLAASLELVENSEGTPKLHLGFNETNVIRILKSVTIDYILSNPSLMAQQKGQGRILKELFGDFLLAIVDNSARTYLPRRFEPIIEDYDAGRITARRAACDCICGLTEREAISIHSRLQGIDGGSVLHPIVR